MKINEHLPVTAKQNPSENQASPHDFERWLNSPTQQNSGDEYYWQHQEQLQQSALNFNAAPAVALKKTPSTPNHAAVDSHARTQQEPTPMPTQELPSKALSLNTHNSQFTAMKLGTELRALEQLLTPSAPFASSNKAPLKTNNNAPLPKTATKGATTSTVLQSKKHHLFVQDENAELTLNTHELASDEQEQLEQLIQSSLKQKGLILRKFTINGVTK
ncbi:MAG: hypothetical protein ACHP65_01375 [Legionellales bacterium]